MRSPDINDYVRLTHDIPNLDLHRGEVGIIRSLVFAPAQVFEVEFHTPGCPSDTRAILNANQVELRDGDADAMETESVSSMFA